MRIEQFWERSLRILQRHQPTLQRWRWAARPDHLRLELDLAEGAAHTLRIAPQGSGARWFRTASADVLLQSDGTVQDLPPVLEQLQALVLRADPGNLEFVLPAPSLDPIAKREQVPPVPDPAAQAALAPELHWASFLAWSCLITEDLYPHVSPLGELIDNETLLGLWAETAARHRTGRAPEKLGLYVHIPFCAVACTFCYCAKTDDFRRDHVARYVDDLIEEAEMFSPVLGDLPFTSVYFGGGTPSMLTPPQMDRLFAALWSAFHVPAGTQIIFEGNPDSLSDRKIEVLATKGRVTRLTIGVQTLDAEVQRLVRRHNQPEQVRAAVDSARRWGIPTVNLDLMAGLPGQTLASFLADLHFLLSCEPDSLHINSYRPLPRVSLEQGRDAQVSAEHIALRTEMQQRAEEVLAAAGHADTHNQGRRRTHSAANLQEYDLRRQNSSLLGLGVPSRAHAFAGAYYMPEFASGFEVVRSPRPVRQRRWKAVLADEVEEQHKFLVSNILTGFSRAEYRALFGHDVLERHRTALHKLAALGAIRIHDDEIESWISGAVDSIIYRGFLYSPTHDQRARTVWGHDYDPDVDYRSRLEKLMQT